MSLLDARRRVADAEGVTLRECVINEIILIPKMTCMSVVLVWAAVRDWVA